MSDSMLIPRVFHFIWIGPNDLSEEHQKNIASWRHHHPDWEVQVWRNEDVPRLRNQAQFDQALSMAGKADILRTELVHDHGGVYLDIDMECLRSIDELLAGCEGFLTCEHQSGRIGNAVFGAVPGHDFTRQLVEAIPRWFHPKQPHRTGPTLFTHMGRRSATMRVFEQKIFFPPSTDDQRDSDVLPEFPGSYAVHGYDGSWEQNFPVTSRSGCGSCRVPSGACSSACSGSRGGFPLAAPPCLLDQELIARRYDLRHVPPLLLSSTSRWRRERTGGSVAATRALLRLYGEVLLTGTRSSFSSGETRREEPRPSSPVSCRNAKGLQLQKEPV